MFKAFAALVVSMTCGAFLLSGLEPNIEESAKQPGILLHARGLTSAFAPAPWTRVEVFGVTDSERNTVTVNGVELYKQAHLFVDDEGLLRAGEAWRDRVQLPGFDETVVICVSIPATARQPSDKQVAALTLLLRRLKQELGIPSAGIRFQSFHPVITDLERALTPLLG